jgi:hypothetical protein
MMTREEMCEAIQRVGVLLDHALDAGRPLIGHSLHEDAWRDIGTAQGMLASVVAALEAEKPLATGFAHTEIWYLLPGENKVVWVIKPQRSLDTDIAVTITERREPQVEEAPQS